MKLKDVVISSVALLMSTGMVKAEALDTVKKDIENYSYGDHTIDMQNDYYGFSNNFASLSMELLSKWNNLDEMGKMAYVKNYVDTIYPEIKNIFNDNSISNRIKKGDIIVDALQNAKLLLEDDGHYLNENIEDSVLKSINKYITKQYGETFIFVNNKSDFSDLAWAQHGAHFPNMENKEEVALGSLIEEIKNDLKQNKLEKFV